MTGILEICRAHQPVIIYGAGPIGEIVLHTIKEQHIENILFCDENPAKRVGGYLGKTVISKRELVEKYKDSAVLLTPMRELSKAKASLEELGISKLYDVKEIINHTDIENTNWQLNTAEYLEYCCKTYLYELKERKGLCLRYMDFPVTQRCNLSCQSCANLMPYFEQPEDYDLPSLFTYFDALEKYVDEIFNLTILGGEPLLYQQLPEVIEYLAKSPKIRQLILFTNATIIPNDRVIAALKKNQVLVQISRYEGFDSKVDTIIELFKKEKIVFSLPNIENWNDFGNLENRGRNGEECQKLYRKCRAKATLSYVKGKLFHCVRASHGYMLGLGNDKDSVDLLNHTHSIEEKQQELKLFLAERDDFTACNFCNGYAEDSRTIKSAKQKQIR